MKIVTDCAADLTPEDIREYDITVAPLFIHFPKNEQVNAMDLAPDDFYNRLEAMVPQIPTTAQPSAGLFAELYKKLTDLGEEILSVHISSGLSGTIDSARTGAQNFPQAVVNFVDTLTLSGGERFQVLAAARALRAGWSIDKIFAQLQQVQKATETIYTLETLTYLARGGRIGRVQALAGTLLNLKPVIKVDHADGKYSTVTKARTLNKALIHIADHLAAQYDQNTPVWVSVLHGRFAHQADELAELLRQRLNIAKMEILRISPVLGVHTGPGIVGAAVIPYALMDIS